MNTKILKKYKSALVWKGIVITCAVLFVAFILIFRICETFFSINIDFVATRCAVSLTFITMISCYVYFVFKRPTLKSVEILKSLGISIDSAGNELENCITVGKKGRIKCGYKVCLFPDPFVIIPYSEILWAYISKTKALAGLLTTNVSLSIKTMSGVSFELGVTEKDFKEFVLVNRDKFSAELMVGYTSENIRKYKEIRKKERVNDKGKRAL